MPSRRLCCLLGTSILLPGVECLGADRAIDGGGKSVTIIQIPALSTHQRQFALSWPLVQGSSISFMQHTTDFALICSFLKHGRSVNEALLGGAWCIYGYKIKLLFSDITKSVEYVAESKHGISSRADEHVFLQANLGGARNDVKRLIFLAMAVISRASPGCDKRLDNAHDTAGFGGSF